MTIGRRAVEIGGLAVAGVALLLVLYNATLVDRRPPSVAKVSLSATAGSDHVGQTLTAIDIEFSEPVRTASVERRFSIQPYVAGAFTWDDQRVAIFTPSKKLPSESSFSVTISAGFEDLAGNAATTPTDPWSFTTVGPPTIASTTPAANATDVPVAAPVVLTFDRLMDTTSVEQALRVQPAAPFHMNWSGQAVTIAFDEPLRFGTDYTVSIGASAADTDGSHLKQPYDLTFSTVSGGLGVVNAIPQNGVSGVSVRSPIAVVFDAPIDPATANAALQITPSVTGSVQVVTLPDDRVAQAAAATSPSPSVGQPSASPIGSIASIGPSASPSSAPQGSAAASPSPVPTAAPNQVIVFTPSAPLAPHTTYTVVLLPVVARDGSPGQVAPGRAWSFTTGQATTSAQNQVTFLSARSGVRNVWIMNPDGSNARQLTTELSPVSSFDLSADGRTLFYSAAGAVKMAATDGTSTTVLTKTGLFEYAPALTPDGRSIVVGRRDAAGTDRGYWLVPVPGTAGQTETQLATTGAPPPGSVAATGDALGPDPAGTPYDRRTAFSDDGRFALLVTASGQATLLDLAADARTPATSLPLSAPSPATWDRRVGSFLIVGDGPAGDGIYRVSTGGIVTRAGSGSAGIAVAADGWIATFGGGDGQHVAVASAPALSAQALTTAVDLVDRSPSFSPDGESVLFVRVPSASPQQSAGIWLVRRDGRELRQLTTDGSQPRWLP